MRTSNSPSGDPKPPKPTDGLIVLDGCSVCDLLFLGLLGDVLASSRAIGVADAVWLTESRHMDVSERRAHERRLEVVGLSSESLSWACSFLKMFPKLSTDEALSFMIRHERRVTEWILAGANTREVAQCEGLPHRGIASLIDRAIREGALDRARARLALSRCRSRRFLADVASTLEGFVVAPGRRRA